MRSPKWISELAVMLLHAETLAEHGGREGIRDAGALESALARPKNLFAFEGITEISRLAASCSYGIARNHPFIDGNKRVAFLVLGLFLSNNGRELRATQPEATDMMLRLGAGEVDEDALASWVREHSVKQKS